MWRALVIGAESLFEQSCYIRFCDQKPDFLKEMPSHTIFSIGTLIFTKEKYWLAIF